jgi:hypothetical protein
VVSDSGLKARVSEGTNRLGFGRSRLVASSGHPARSGPGAARGPAGVSSDRRRPGDLPSRRAAALGTRGAVARRQSRLRGDRGLDLTGQVALATHPPPERTPDVRSWPPVDRIPSGAQSGRFEPLNRVVARDPPARVAGPKVPPDCPDAGVRHAADRSPPYVLTAARKACNFTAEPVQ